MDLLDKFDAVKMLPDARISETDRKFCEAHQRAYEAARSCFMEMIYIWDDISSTQMDILSEVETNASRWNLYLPSSDNFCISAENLHKHIKSLHCRLINNIVTHFNQKYHVTLDNFVISENLLPREPDIDYENREQSKAALKEYLEKLHVFVLRYENVLDLLFVQLNGRTLQEQALFELKAKCHNAVWNSKQSPDYELKKNILRLTFACNYSSWYSHNPWELLESTRTVIYGIAHYETGAFSVYPHSISHLFGQYRFDDDVILFDDCEKVKQLKMFKNRRVDIKFTTAAYASQFVAGYLGLVY